MPRRPYAGEAGTTFHVVNRAAHGQLLFANFGEYLLFVRVLERTLRIVPIRLYAFALMPNHFHLLVGLTDDRQLAAFMHLLTMTHARLLRRARGNVGRGAIYQGRYRARAIDTEEYFYRAVRYIARNPVRAGFVQRVEDWPWSSESPVAWLQGITLAPWPLPRPRNWRDFVNGVESIDDLTYFREGIRRNPTVADEPTAANAGKGKRAPAAISEDD